MKKVVWFPLIIAVLFVFSAAPSMAQQADKPAVKTAAVEKAEKPAKAEKPGLTGKININTATADQIALLPGIGPSQAKSIIDYRTTQGNFKKIEDLEKVKGIKEKKIAKIQEYIIFEGETTLKQAN